MSGPPLTPTAAAFETPGVPELADRVRTVPGAFTAAECDRFRATAEAAGFAAATSRRVGG